MMAIMNDAPILPIYIGKREKRIRCQVVIIGDKINPKDYIAGPMATMDEINNLSNLLKEKEEELKFKFENEYKEKKR